MKRFFQRLLNPGGKPLAQARQPVLILAAFGKHPGWDDYLGKGVDTGIGVDTEALADAKEALHEAGIRRQIDSGGWQNLPPEKRLEGFDHSFLWIRAGHVLVGRLWSSSDGKGRLYPMVLCVDGEGITPDFALAKVAPELERLRAACVATTSAEQVTAEYLASQEALRSLVGGKELVLMPPPLSVEVRRQFLEHADLGPERIGLLRALHEIGATGQPGERGSAAGAGFPSRHLRLPLAADSPRHALLLWAEFLGCALPASTPLLLISRGGMGWMDAILGEPAGDDLFCLQASTQALALVSHVPYDLSPELKPRLQEIEAGFLRVDSAGAGVPRARSGVNASGPPTLSGAVPAIGKKSPLLFLGGLLLIGVVVLGLWAVSRNRGSPPAAGQLAVRSNSPTTGATVLAQARVRTNAADSARESARLKEEAAQRRLAEEKKAAVEKAEREQQELRLRAAAAQASKVAEAATAKAPVAVQAGNEAVQVAGQNRAEDEKAQARAQENDADLAQISLAQGNYQRVLELCRKWPGVARFQPVLAKAVAETNLLQQMTDYLLAGNYAPMLASQLPENDKFKELVSKASAEKKVLDQGAGEFAEGNYAFLQREQVQSLKAKVPFQKLLQEGAAEELQLKQAQQLRQAGKPQEARDFMVRAGLRKPPFVEIQQWATTELARIGGEQKDAQTAKSFFEQGDYARALELCRKYPGHAAFEAMARSIGDEQKILAGAQAGFLAGDYAAVGKLAGTVSQAKPPLAELLRKAGEEQKTFNELEKLKQANEWQAVAVELNRLPAELVRKKPFETVRQWAQAKAAEDELLKKSDPASLDADFEKLLVWFNVLKPTDPKIRTAAARKETMLGALGPRSKDYLRRAESLEEEYKKGGWLNQNDRQKLLNKLKETIRYWE